MKLAPLTMILTVLVAALFSPFAAAQSEYEFFETSKWGPQYIKKNFTKDEFGASLEVLVNIKNPSDFPVFRGKKLNPSSMLLRGFISCSERKRVYNYISLFSDNWATGRILDEGAISDNGFIYSEQEWSQNNYSEKFCKKPKRFGIF